MNRHRLLAFTLLVIVLLITGCARRVPVVKQYRPPPTPKSQLEAEATKEVKETEPEVPVVVKIGEVPKTAETKIEPIKIGKIEPKIVGRIARPAVDKKDENMETFTESYLNHDGTVLLTKSQKAIRTWDVATGKQLYAIEMERSKAAYFASPNAKFVARVDMKEKKTDLLQAHDGQLKASFPFKGQANDFKGTVLGSFSPNGDRFLFINRSIENDNRFFAIQEIDCTTGSGRKLATLELPTVNDNETLDGLIATAQADLVIITRYLIGSGGKVSTLSFAWTGSDNKLSPIDWLSDPEYPFTRHLPQGQQLAISSDKRFLCSIRGGSHSLTWMVDFSIRHTFEKGKYESLSCPVFTPDGQRMLLLQSWDRNYQVISNKGTNPYRKDTLNLVNLRSGEMISSFTHDHLGWSLQNYLAKHISISGDGNRIALTRNTDKPETVVLDFQSCFGLPPLPPR
jgi:hypothetical protein